MNFKRESLDIKIPFRRHEDDAGWDLYSPITITIKPGKTETIDLGLSFEVPWGYHGLIVERSSQGKAGVMCLGPIIDSGYTGNVHAILYNSGTGDYLVTKGDRICQLLLMAQFTGELHEVTKLTNSERGSKGLGSSGK
jgi:dUTP pyrophosphatase